jgi:hypothetical protein
VSNGYDGGKISYNVDWGDGTSIGRMEPLASGINYTTNHAWTLNGIYTVTVTAIPSEGNYVKATTQVKVSTDPSKIVGTLSTSDASVVFNASVGGANPPVRTISLTNTTSARAGFSVSAPNQPAWLNCRYSNDTIYLSAGEVSSVCASADVSKVSGPGTYTTNVIVSGSFSNSPLTIPITLNVTGANGCTRGDAYREPVATTNSIGSVTIISPNSGECWEKGSHQTITWRTSTNIDKVSIMLQDSSGTGNWVVTDNPNTGIFGWNVFPWNTTNTQFRFQIIGYQTGTGSVTDTSDGYFTIY